MKYMIILSNKVIQIDFINKSEYILRKIMLIILLKSVYISTNIL